MMMELLDQAIREGLLRPIDVQFARMIAPDHCPALQLAAAYLSAEVGAGHICLPITSLQPQCLFAGRQPELTRALWHAAKAPDVQCWRDSLQCSPSVSDGSQPTPLVLQYDRLYLQRMWQSEGDVVRFIAGSRVNEAISENQLRNILDQLFGTDTDEVDWQKIAAAVAVTGKISVISGGPGTGKTTTVAKLLIALIRLTKGAQLRIQLAAPTGKAAARLSESLEKTWQQLALNEIERKRLPDQASTLHGLLGIQLNSQRLRYHPANPLNLDVLVVDEASMVDLPMMAKLIAALPAKARVIFLGDRDQLASVEAGAVFGDICRLAVLGYSTHRAEQLARVTGYRLDQLCNYHREKKNETLTTETRVGDSLCLLKKSYRFDKKSGIGQLAEAVNTGKYQRALSVLQRNHTDVEYVVLTEAENYKALLQASVIGYHTYLEQVMQGNDAAEILAAFNRYQLLCALRAGSFGVSGLNQKIEHILRNKGLIRCSKRLSKDWYSGRPIMIGRNDSALGLFNGDVGIALPGAHGHLRVYFQLPNGDIKSVQPNRLPYHDTAYAMTVHKSQGSEFEHTALVLPPHFSPLITRELLYTGITRARRKLTLYASHQVLNHAINTSTLRRSGLVDRLYSRIKSD